jgi:hypothetical protein
LGRRLIYDVAHKAMRAHFRPQVLAGLTRCCLCGEPIEKGAPWDLAHDDSRNFWLGPSHMQCNRGDAARKTNRLRWEWEERRVSREW